MDRFLHMLQLLTKQQLIIDWDVRSMRIGLLSFGHLIQIRITNYSLIFASSSLWIQNGRKMGQLTGVCMCFDFFSFISTDKNLICTSSAALISAGRIFSFNRSFYDFLHWLILFPHLWIDEQPHSEKKVLQSDVSSAITTFKRFVML